MKITPSTAILLAAALSTNTLVQGRALPFAGGLEVLRDSAVALARRDIGPDVSAVTDIFRRSAAPVPPPGGRNTNPNRDRGRDRPGKPTGGRPRPRPNKDGDGSGGDGDNGAPLCRRMPGGCGETPEGYERPSYKIKDGENEIDFFALGKLTRAGEVKQGVKAQTYPKDTIESNYYSTKPKQVKPEEAAVVEGGSPASTKSDHQLNLKVPFADKIFGGKLSDTKPWSRVRTHTREKGANDDADYADAGAAIDAFYSPESGALIAEETFAAKDSNKGNNRVPLSTVQIQKYKDLAGEDAGPPQYVVRRSVSEKVTAQINKARTALGKKNDGTRVTFEPSSENQAMDDGFTMAEGTDNVRGIDLAIRAGYPGPNNRVTKIHTWTGLGEEDGAETVVIIEFGDPTGGRGEGDRS